MKPPNVFAGPYLDRAAHLRQDSSWLAAALADSASLAIPLWSSRNLITQGEAPRAVFLPLSEVPASVRKDDDLLLLGRKDGVDYFAFEFESVDPPATPPGSRFEDLRLAAGSLPAAEAGLLAYARAMTFWRRRHRFCGTCGTPTAPAKNGHVLVCTNPACRHETFPRIDPAIIVLVSDGERALLGRQSSWPAGRYSTIAGFVEPGESLEDAVRREVQEETGIDVDEVDYHSSQPWPFPSSLMLGFLAHARTTRIELLDRELEDARWFTRAEVASGTPRVPPSVSISYRLIEHWFDAGGGRRLRETLGSEVPWTALPRG